MDTLTLLRPDDWHSHLRDGDSLERTCGDMCRYMGRVIVMPNLVPPVSNVRLAAEYRQRILRAMSGAARPFDPLMTLYLTDSTSADDIREGAATDWLAGVKLYPAGATTNSAAGVNSLEALYPILATMEEVDLPLLVHGEVTDSDVDIFDREAAFIDQHLAPIVGRFPQLRVVLEHITTADSVDFVSAAGPRVGATITAHHLLLNRNDMLVGGIRPHYYCLPILKRRRHQEALRAAATGSDRSFFIGTDSAPHEQASKESACGCAGVYTAHASLEFYAEVFEEMNALDVLEDFAARRGPDFYGRPVNSDTITLRRVAWDVPEALSLGDTVLVPLRAGEKPALAGGPWRERLSTVAIRERFRGFLPVIVDFETGGFTAATDAILEVAATIVRMDDAGELIIHQTHSFNVSPFEGANIEQSALDFTGIDPYHPFREAQDETLVFGELFRIVRKEIRDQGCNRAILVGHNAHFDAGFMNAAVERCDIKRNPFHPFSHFDTATLAGLAFGQTVLAKSCAEAGIAFDNEQAHSAAYDAERTAELFCIIVNRWLDLGGWHPAGPGTNLPAAGDEAAEG